MKRREDSREMGFDVYGIEPKNKDGEYFRNTVWWWRPLWDYINEVTADVISEDQYSNGHTNSGEVITSTQCSEICEILDLDLKSKDGIVKSFASSRQMPIGDGNYPFDRENVERFLGFLKNCGGFEIW